ncbi:MAG TPA: hypothetical protein ENN80_06230, partial [Candidatus Hydrogenedentes bacterium]|nr:hypothetical protein [Candidatus Hydrogenedentota bacterium]
MLLVILVVLACVPALAMVSRRSWAEEERPDWENPGVVEINKQPGHATLFPFVDRQAAVAGGQDASRNYVSLNGVWKFAWAERPSDAPEEFYAEDCNVSRWADIEVPGNWQMQGYE